MIMRKKNFAILFLTAVAICLTVLTFALKSPTLAYASRSNQGTDTVDEWSGTKTTGNLITIGSGSLTEQGWNNIHNQVYGEGRAYDDKNVGLKTPEYGWGIQAKGTNDDIGDKNYENGVWYRITLSEADRVKANNGELTVYASAMYYCQTAATHYVSLKLFYEDESGKQLDVDEMTDKITKSAYVLTLNGHPVRKNTASIRYYVSNWGTLGARPFIGGMKFTLSDSRAPKLENITSDKSGICDVTNNVAIAGDTLKYYLELSEKVSVDSYGTAKLGLDGTATSVTGDGSLITENGKSKICYTFKLTELGKSGALSLYSVSGLSVKDEAGNAFTYNKSDISSDTVQYYKQMYVASRLTNLKTNGKTAAFYGTDYTATLVPNAGYDLPQSVKVNVSGRTMDSAGYTYNKTTGLVTIKGKYVKGNLEIVAVGVPKTCMVTFDKQDGSGGTNSTTATYTSAMPQVTAPTLKGYTFQGYYASPNGQGKQYYTATGASANDCDFYTATTLYAHWTANSYTVKYDQNKPAATSGTVKGTTSNSSHTYNEAKALTPNGYSLAGYAFIGWATTANGSVVYKDKDSVQNLSSVDGATVTLYAVWKANTYYVEYDSNKPATASGTMTGTTSRSTHAYDASSALSESGFVLKGWTFVGWAQTADATSAQYAGGENVANLASEDGAIVKLYAVWQANTYNVTYAANKPATASGTTVGSTAQTTHTYEQASAAAINGYSLVGWTFIGWSQNSNATAIDFADGADVLNLADTQGATVTLYAVWKANTYYVEYDSNKPATASGTMTGTTSRSTHAYDTSGALSESGFVLKGWTFVGWTQTADATSAQYAGGENVTNLASEEGAIVKLYAVWKANTYNVTYVANKPTGSSGTVTGETAQTTHSYDQASAAAINGFSLIGWSFIGWSQNPNATAIDFANGADVLNLADTQGATETLYAVWKANVYTITFDAVGGSLTEATRDATYDGSLSALAAPVRKGYNFNGYYSELDGNGIQYFDADGNSTVMYTVAGDVTLYAHWTPVTYNIQLYSQGQYVDTIYNVVFGHMRLPSAETLNVTRDNYNFVGWNLYDDQNWAMYNADTDYGTGIAYVEGETVILYAAWAEKPIFTISYDANGGIGAPAMAQAHQDETIVISNVVPTRKNYTFLGWATEADAVSAQYSPSDAFTMGSAVVTFYAVWKLNPSLTYDANGGTFSVPAERVYPMAGQTIALTDLVPERIGYVFQGWSADKDAAAAEYASGQNFTMPNADTVLFAVWKKAQYVVTVSASEGFTVIGLDEYYYYGQTASFSVTGNRPKVYVNGQRLTEDENGQFSFVVSGDSRVLVADGSKLSLIYSANGGANAPTDETSYTADSTATVSAIAPERLGYTFIGWSTDANADKAEFTANQALTFASDDIVLYAVWQANAYTVSYDNGGGEGTMPDDTFYFGTAGALSANAFRKAGNTFIGWALSKGGEAVYGDGATIVDLCSQNGDNVILYAVWERTVTEITFVTDDGTEFNSPVSIVYGDKLTSDGIVAPVRKGYIFAGYRTERNGLGELIFDADLNVAYTANWDKNVGKLTLYSCWIPVSYTIVYVNGQKEVGKQAAVYGQSFDLLSASSLGVTAPAGYHFAGWSTVPSGQTVAYLNQQTIAEALTTTDGDEVYLYAVFAANQKFSIVYHANGGSNAPVDNNKYFAGDLVTLSSVIPVREGYIFGGWSYGTGGVADIPYTSDGGFQTDVVAMKDGGLTLYAVWIVDGKTLQEQIDEINGVNASLASAIDDLNATSSGFSDQLTKLGDQMKSAQDLLFSLDDTYVTKTELAEKVTELKGLLAQAEADLTAKINTVQANLDKAVTDLNATIDGNKQDLENKLADVKKFYEDLKAFTNSELGKLQDKDTELAQKIADVETKLQETDTKLVGMINKVQGNLEQAVSDLNATINGNKQDLENKLAEVKKFYEDLKAFTNSELGKLQDKDTELSHKIADVETKLQETDTKLVGMINKVQGNLEQAVSDLNATIDGNKQDLENKLADVKKFYEDLKTFTNSELGKLQDKDTELAQKLGTLETKLQETDDKLVGMINKVQGNLEQAVTDLNATIDGNKQDLENKLADVKKFYEDLKAFTNSELGKLQDKDTELAQKIADVETKLQETDTKLVGMINKVQGNLEQAVSDLNATINGNKQDLENKLAEVKKFYEDLKAFTNSELGKLQDKDTELSQKIADVETKLQETDTKLVGMINKVQGNLEQAVSDLNATIDGNKQDLENKLAEVKKFYEDLKAFTDSELEKLQAKDTELSQKIADVDQSLKDTDSKLVGMIETVQANLDKEVEKLNKTISTNQQAVEARLKAIEDNYKILKAFVESNLADLQAKDTELAQKLGTLEAKLQQTNDDLVKMINTVQSNLDKEVGALKQTITTNQQAVEARLKAIEDNYKALKAFVESNLADLQAKDSELSQKLGTLETTLQQTDEKLVGMIETVQANLDTAIGNLTEAIAANKDDIESKLSQVERASANADAIIRSDLVKLAQTDDALTERIAALENSSKAAHEAIWAGINQVQKNLDAAKWQLEQKDRELEEKIGLLQAENDKVATACMAAIIVLAAALALIVWLAVSSAEKKS